MFIVGFAAEIKYPSDVPKESRAWQSMVLEDEEYLDLAKALAAAVADVERAGGKGG